ncbi:MAG: DNA topology modulation protein [Clostridia bacterium]|nr:DNA topology modulation protein [Clostridia bacterium]
MKIAIVGYSGSGKSTLARTLGAYHHAEVLHLDTVHHLAGWKERDRESKEKIVKTFLDGHSDWVIDGNYAKLFYDRRMEEADLIVMLLFNRFNCLCRAYKRYRKYKGKSRPDMTAGCDEKMDRAFVWWILHEGRSKTARDRYRRVQTQYAGKVVVLKNQKQLDAFVQTLQ